VSATLNIPREELVEVVVANQGASPFITVVKPYERSAARNDTLCYCRDIEPGRRVNDEDSFLKYVLDMPEADGFHCGWVVETDVASGFFRAMFLKTRYASLAVC